MKVMAVDDERLALENIMGRLKEVLPDADLIGFQNAYEAFDYLSKEKVDVAFLDIEMGGLNGIELANKCKDLCPTINIIFVTGYSEYALDALKLHASGYLMKPVRVDDLKQELDNLRNPIGIEVIKRVRIQTFGNFEVFVDEKPIKFAWAKCKECFAYIVDRKGARVSVPELAGILWEDRPYDRKTQNNTYRAISDMVKTFKILGVEDILIKSRKDVAVDISKVTCDYYQAIHGNEQVMHSFSGEYMSNYSWAEFTLSSFLSRK